MKYTEITFLTPEENLACDEALLEASEEGLDEEILRFWEPKQYFAVLGYSNKAKQEVNLAACQKNKIPVLRRASGGGTVLQGPGCLNFSLILKIKNAEAFRSITETNRYIMNRHQQALEPIVGSQVDIQGITDLALNQLKFSGNAQRRKKYFLLFHGTFLLRFDIEKIETYLAIPKKQPAYRNNRTHKKFLTNVNLSASEIKKTIRNIWNADGTFEKTPLDRIRQLAKERYGNEEWNFKF
jgi:lipoate-protein ligase A